MKAANIGDDAPGGISPAEARAFYDRLGSWQDASGLFENPGIRALLKAGDFGAARNVLELGCGTGRVAAELRRFDRILRPGKAKGAEKNSES